MTRPTAYATTLAIFIAVSVALLADVAFIIWATQWKLLIVVPSVLGCSWLLQNDGRKTKPHQCRLMGLRRLYANRGLSQVMSAFGTKRTFRWRQSMSTFGGKADMPSASRNIRF
jgi:hypothetical protein